MCLQEALVTRATREKGEDMIHSFPLLESLHLIYLPNLVRLCSFGTYESWDKQQFMVGIKIICHYRYLIIFS